jgi:hypothetical protein
MRQDVDAVQGDRTRVPSDGSPASTSELSALRNVDSHAVSQAARMIAVTRTLVTGRNHSVANTWADHRAANDI